MKHKRSYDKSVFQALTLITQFGINMMVPIGLMTFLGVYLDKRFGTSYLVVLLFFVGAIAGGQNVYRLATKIYGKKEQKEKNDRENQKD